LPFHVLFIMNKHNMIYRYFRHFIIFDIEKSEEIKAITKMLKDNSNCISIDAIYKYKVIKDHNSSLISIE